MDILKALDIDLNERELICFVGGGGKTTTMFAIAQALKSLNKKVLVTTSTHIFYPDPVKEKYDNIIINNSEEIGIFNGIDKSTVTVFGSDVVDIANGRKLSGPNKEFIENLFKKLKFDYILVECDGSKRKPIKAPADYEPVVPNNATKTIGVIGLDAIGNPIDEEHVHRNELFCDVAKRSPGERLDEEAVVNLILSSAGLFKGVPNGSERYILLNKADDAQRRKYAKSISARLKEKKFLPKCIIAAMADNRLYT
ncbi:MAG: putative selenium-dependent hydroxylase accessory protein YqeC [Proteobacteria bacterium]|nr:putative selenium-dependent hydroxylase accessory protein YqeC [Pseudomonadota bacterium]